MTKPIPELSAKDKARFWSYVDVRGPDECWPWTAYKTDLGYGQFGVNGRKLRAHRVAMALDRRDPLDLLACHTCDNPPCCNVAHLWAGTCADNHADRDDKGRQASGDRNGSRTKPECLARGEANGSRTKPERVARGERHYSRTKPERLARGERHGSAKVTDAQVIAIRADTRFHRIIAIDYGVSASVISHIKTRRTWSHVL